MDTIYNFHIDLNQLKVFNKVRLSHRILYRSYLYTLRGSTLLPFHDGSYVPRRSKLQWPKSLTTPKEEELFQNIVISIFPRGIVPRVRISDPDITVMRKPYI